MDERQLKKLEAAAEHLTGQANLAMLTSERQSEKAARFKEAAKEAEAASKRAASEAKDLAAQAKEARAEWERYADGENVTAAAGAAHGEGGA